MKNLKELLEASLLDIDGTLHDGDEYAKRYETFGFKYKLTYIFTSSSENQDWIDTYKLQKLTKDMYVNNRLNELCKEFCITPQLYFLAIYIDNISRTELKMDDKKNLCHLRSDDKRVKSFSENLQKILIDSGILKSKNGYIQTYITGARNLMIHIDGVHTEWIEFEYKFVE
jgi:hypothetical protein